MIENLVCQRTLLAQAERRLGDAATPTGPRSLFLVYRDRLVFAFGRRHGAERVDDALEAGLGNGGRRREAKDWKLDDVKQIGALAEL